jgi:hypothetical protein
MRQGRLDENCSHVALHSSGQHEGRFSVFLLFSGRSVLRGQLVVSGSQGQVLPPRPRHLLYSEHPIQPMCGEALRIR